MKKSVAMRWVKALRSGKFKQGRKGKLKLKSGYCCLGVLCEIEKLEGFRNECLSGQAVKKVGMACENGLIRNLKESLAALNDGNARRLGIETQFEREMSTVDKTRFTFDEIADLIQINWKSL